MFKREKQEALNSEKITIKVFISGSRSVLLVFSSFAIYGTPVFHVSRYPASENASSTPASCQSPDPPMTLGEFDMLPEHLCFDLDTVSLRTKSNVFISKPVLVASARFKSD